jgi:protein TonB
VAAAGPAATAPGGTTVPAGAPAAPAGDRDAAPRAGNALPAYPTAAREDSLEGVVTLSVRLDAQGQVLDVQWQQRSGVPVLDHAARDAVRQWRFQPALRAGQPVPAVLSLSLRFRLDAPVWFAAAPADRVGTP